MPVIVHYYRFSGMNPYLKLSVLYLPSSLFDILCSQGAYTAVVTFSSLGLSPHWHGESVIREPAVRALVCFPWITTFDALRCKSLKGNLEFLMQMISVGTAKWKQTESGQKTDFDCAPFSGQGSQSRQR